MFALTEIFVTRGMPDFIRSDNGSEFTAQILQDWLKRLEVETAFITPGSPWENGYNESFNGKFRDEFLSCEAFYTLQEARILTDAWRYGYNHIRPHTSLGYKPPAPLARFKEGLSANATNLSLKPQPHGQTHFKHGLLNGG